MGNISTHNEEKEGFSKNKNAHRYYSVAPPLQSSSRGLSKRALKSIAATTAIEAATEFAAAEIAKAEIVDVKPLYAAGMDLARKDLAWTHATELVAAAEQEQTELNKRSGQEFAATARQRRSRPERYRRQRNARPRSSPQRFHRYAYCHGYYYGYYHGYYHCYCYCNSYCHDFHSQACHYRRTVV